MPEFPRKIAAAACLLTLGLSAPAVNALAPTTTAYTPNCNEDGDAKNRAVARILLDNWIPQVRARYSALNAVTTTNSMAIVDAAISNYPVSPQSAIYSYCNGQSYRDLQTIINHTYGPEATKVDLLKASLYNAIISNAETALSNLAASKDVILAKMHAGEGFSNDVIVFNQKSEIVNC